MMSIMYHFKHEGYHVWGGSDVGKVEHDEQKGGGKPHARRLLFFRPATASYSSSAASPAPAIGRDALIGNPHVLRQFAGLPEHVDRNAAARIPVAANAQPFRFDFIGDPLADHHRAVLMEGAVI